MVGPSGAFTCPDHSVLADLVAGVLSRTRAADVDAHLQQCEHCRDALRELQRDEELSGQLRSALGLDRELDWRQRLAEATAGEYEILETLGHGGGGVVFKAKDVKLQRAVAIKCLWADADGRQMQVLQEARNLAAAGHPHIAAVHAVSDRADLPFVVMEFVDGVAITQALGHRPIDQQIEAFAQVLDAVAELHRRGIVHCDLKPSNILVDHRGKVKLVDLGIAQRINATVANQSAGTPAYMSPQRALGQAVGTADDVFSLGVILFELLTGQRPFGGADEAQMLTAIRQSDPPMPRSLRPQIPGALQAICLTALEKDATLRYPGAREFLLDVRRFLSGDAVWANPKLLTGVLEHGIERHVQELRRWQQDRVITARECDYFLDKYERLQQREESWVLDSRRISFSQVMLHLGVWSCVVGAFLMLAFAWPQIGAARPIFPALLFAGLIASGSVLWRIGNRRVGVVLLMGSSICLPIAVATVLIYFGWLGGRGDQDLLDGIINNRQLLISTLLWLVLSLGIWHRTQTAALAAICTFAMVAVATAIFALHDLRGQLAEGHSATVAGWYLAPGVILFAIGMAWDLGRKKPAFAASFYVAGLVILLICLSLIAYFGPTLRWIGWQHDIPDAQMTRQINYGFMINGAIYLLFGLLADRSASSAWLRWMGVVLLWLAPTHLLLPILRLEDQWRISGSSWTAAEIILPIAALILVFCSVPKQLKSFFFSGLFYLAVSLQRLTNRHFENRLGWPISVVMVGITLTVIAWRWPALFEGRGQRRRV